MLPNSSYLTKLLVDAHIEDLRRAAAHARSAPPATDDPPPMAPGERSRSRFRPPSQLTQPRLAGSGTMPPLAASRDARSMTIASSPSADATGPSRNNMELTQTQEDVHANRR